MLPVVAVATALAQFAPLITKWLGGSDDSVAVAEKVTSIATSVAGVKTPEEAIEIFKKNGEKAWEFKLQVIQQEKDLEIAYLSDRDSARKRDMAFVQAGVRNKRADFLAVIAVLALIACIAALFTMNLPEGAARDTLLILLGTLTAIVKDVYQFEFGTSRSSQGKDVTIQNLTKGG